MSASPPLRTILLAATAWVALSATANAQESAWGDDIAVMDDLEMQDLRGGIAVNGIEIGFGAVVTTILNGVPVLTTNLTITDAGAIVEQTMATVGQNLQDMTPEALTALGLEGLGDEASGIVIEDESGVTALVHNVTNSALQNIIVNSATGRDISQNIDVTLTLPGFEFIQAELMLERFGMRLHDDLAGFLIGSGGD